MILFNFTAARSHINLNQINPLLIMMQQYGVPAQKFRSAFEIFVEGCKLEGPVNPLHAATIEAQLWTIERSEAQRAAKDSYEKMVALVAGAK